MGASGLSASARFHTAFNTMSFVGGFALGLAAIAMRRTAFIHKRLILGTTVLLTTASPTRALGFLGIDLGFYGNQLIIGLPLVALVIYDFRHYRRPWIALIPATAFLLVNTLYIHRPLLVNPTGEVLMAKIAPPFMPWGATWPD
jgi:hypothetical protein